MSLCLRLQRLDSWLASSRFSLDVEHPREPNRLAGTLRRASGKDLWLRYSDVQNWEEKYEGPFTDYAIDEGPFR